MGKREFRGKKEIPILVAQFTSTTFVPNLSQIIIEVATRQITGVIHLAGSTRISRYDFAMLISKKLNLDKNLLIPIKADKMNWKAQRPTDSSFDVSLITEILNEKPLKIEQSLDLFFNKLK